MQGIRAELDDSNESMQKKIKMAQLKKIPYMLIIGDNEAESGTVSVRLRSGEELKQVPLNLFSPLLVYLSK